MTRPGMGRPDSDRDEPQGVSGDLDDGQVVAPVVAATDLRLLVPALVGWGLVALALSWPSWAMAVVAGGGLLLLPVAWFIGKGRGERRSDDALPGGEPPDDAPPEGEPPDRAPPDHPPSEDGRGEAQPRDRLAWSRLLALSGVVAALVSLSLASWTAVREAGPVRELAVERAVVTVEGVVASDPVVVTTTAGRPGGPPLVVMTVDVDVVTGRGSTAHVDSPVLVLGDQRLLALTWQQRIRLVGRLAPTDDPGDDVVAVLSPTGAATGLEAPGLFARMAGTVRSRFRDAVDHLPADARGLLPGLVIGDTSRTPPDLTAAMFATGMTHLSAVSGSNVAVILTAGLGLCRFVGVRRRWRPLVALGLLLGFVVLVRPEPSVVRAAAMGTVGLLGMSVSRRRIGIPALAAAVIALLCWDPWLARSFGFVLSTLATLGLLLFAAPWGAAIGRWLPRRIRSWGPALAIPVAAQVVCAPVIVLLQSSVSVIGILANLLAAPLVAPATVLGVAVALVSVVWTGGAALLAWLPALPTLGIAWIARTCARAPWGSVPWPGGATGALTLAALSLVLLLCGPWLVHQSRRRPWTALGVGVLAAGVATPTSVVTWPPADWRFVVCDVGQGDGLVLRSASGAVVVVDAGPDPALIDGCLSRLKVTTIEAVVLTHDHADHVDGLPGVLRGRTVRQVLATPVHDPPERERAVEQWASQAHVPLAELFAGDDLAWPGVSAHVWWPARVIHAGSVPNNASIVLTVDVDGVRLALLGDIEREAAHEVLLALRRDPAVLAAGFDVLKVAHHGSSNRDDALYQAIDAPWAMISVGEGNDYGHPAPSTVQALEQDGFRVLRTDVSGDLAVSKDPGGQVAVRTSTS